MAATKVVASGRWFEHGALSVRTEREPAELYVVEFYGELDVAGAEIATRELRQAVQADVEEIIVDLSGLDFIDSTGLQVLVETFRGDRVNGERIRFLRGSDPVDRLMHLTHLDEILPFAD
jgi:anti-sigma B factor antagonist